MGSNHDDDPRSRTGNRHDTAAAAPSSATPGTTIDRFDRDQQMGGSGWSGASGRGGMSDAPSAYGASNRGYGSERGSASERWSGYEHSHEGQFPGDRRHREEEPPGGYARDRRFAHAVGDPSRNAAHLHARARAGAKEDCGFIEERGFGHVPGQRWSGGYGGDRDRDEPSSGPPSGRGFTGNDFGVPASCRGHDYERDRARALEPRPDVHERSEGHERHFGTPVDRGGRMGASEGWAVAVEHEAGMEHDRGPHWGKGPKGYVRSDVRTYEDVCEAIVQNGHVDASDVDVTVDNSIVTLTGTVADRHDKRALEQLAERVRGVHEVHNELRLARNVYGDAARPDERASAQDSQDAAAHAQRNGKGASA